MWSWLVVALLAEVPFTSRDVNPDDDVLAGVQRALENAMGTREAEVEVQVHQGIVTLRGRVPDLFTKVTAGRAVSRVTGVQRVDDQLTVKPAQRRSDRDIGLDVHAALERDLYLYDQRVQFTVLDGVVRVEGSVDTDFKKVHAADLLSFIEGVLKVDNALEVYREPPAERDAKLQRAIRRAFIWNTNVPADDVQVLVDDGVATLEGAVTNDVQRVAAEDAARKAGARRVINHLGVKMYPRPNQ